MSTQAETGRAEQKTSNRTAFRYVFSLLIGPAVALLVYFLLPKEISYGGRAAAATYAWLISWWCLQPVPWVITSVLPLLIFPLFKILDFKATSDIYGQPMLFVMIAYFLLAQGLKKHGLGTGSQSA